MGASCFYQEIEVEASGSYWRMEVVRVSHGQQAVQMVKWYEVDWSDCGHPCQSDNQVALLTAGTISGSSFIVDCCF